MGVCALGQCCVNRYGGPPGVLTVEEWLAMSKPAVTEGETAPVVSAPPQTPVKAPSIRPSLPEQILASVLGIERACRGDAPGDMEAGGAQYQVNRIVDEADFRYCVCYSLESPLVIGYVWARFPDVFLSDLREAIYSQTERTEWDATACFRILKAAQSEDPLREDVFTTLMRAPWPFWDRETLLRRWLLPLSGQKETGSASAIVCQSFLDDSILPEKDDRVRANYHKLATLLRHLHPEKPSPTPKRDRFFGRGAGPPPAEELGAEITVCGQLDLGGLIPAWATTLLSRNTAERCKAWAARLQGHCLKKQAAREAVAIS